MGRKKQRVRWNPVDTSTTQHNDETGSTGGTATMEEVTEPEAIYTKMEIPKDVNCETVSNPGSTHSMTHSHTSSNHSGYNRPYYRGYSSNPSNAPVAKDRTHYHNGPPPPPPHRRYNSNGDRSQGGSPWVAPLAPRFERNKMSNYGVNGGSNGYHRQNSIDGSGGGGEDGISGGGGDGSVTGEDLPNGFTKIRSKDLDVLFKKDYYATAASKAAAAKEEDDGEEGEKEEGREGEEEEPKEGEGEEEVEKVEGANNAGNEDDKENVDNKETVIEAEESETQPPKAKKLAIRTDASPFYPRSYQFPEAAAATTSQFVPAAPAGEQVQPAAAKANLFLYSPASNTIIPCEEIMIPNHSSAAAAVSTTTTTVADAQVAAASYHPGAAAAAAGAVAHPAAAQGLYMTTAYQQQHDSYMATTSTSFPPMMNPAMVHYDQFGVAYTSYVPPYTTAAVPTAPAAAAPAPEAARHAAPEPYAQQLSDSSSSPNSASPAAGDGEPMSPPDLSVYSPANWVQSEQAVYDTAAAAAAAQGTAVVGAKKMASLSVSTYSQAAVQAAAQPAAHATTQQVYYQYQQTPPHHHHHHHHYAPRYNNGHYHYNGGGNSWAGGGGGGGGGSSTGAVTAGNTSSSSAEISPQGRHHRAAGTNGYHYNPRYNNNGNSYSNGYHGKRYGGYHGYGPRNGMGPDPASSSSGAAVHHGGQPTTNESSTVPSSAADSTAEGDRSEEDEGGKKAGVGGGYKKDAKEIVKEERFIPGLNTSAVATGIPPAKRVQKKRRKKKNNSAAVVPANGEQATLAPNAVAVPSVGELNKVSSSSEDIYHQSAAAAAAPAAPAATPVVNGKVEQQGDKIVANCSSVTDSSNCPSPPPPPPPPKPQAVMAPAASMVAEEQTANKEVADEVKTEECTKEITPEENVDSADVNPGCDPNEPCDENETAIHLSYSAVVSSKAAQTTCSTSTQKPSKQSESTGLPELSGAHFSPQRKQQRSRGKKTAAAAAAAAAAVTAQPEQKQLPEQTEEGWEVSGSKTFKRNRKNRSSVKSSVKSYSVQASPDPTPIPLPEEPVPAKEQAEAVVVAIAITDVAEREETVEEAAVIAAVAPEVPKRRNNAQKKQNKQRARREREERALSEERLLAESAVADTAPSRQVGSSKPETVQETARPASYPTSVRPVLIQDGILDVAASSAAFRKVKRVNEVFQDPSRIAQVMSTPGKSALIISDIGHGILDGPLALGRIPGGSGKYSPPDRSDEILPMQRKLMEAAAEAEKKAEDKTVINVIMGEVVTTRPAEEEKEEEVARITDVTDKTELDLD